MEPCSTPSNHRDARVRAGATRSARRRALREKRRAHDGQSASGRRWAGGAAASGRARPTAGSVALPRRRRAREDGAAKNDSKQRQEAADGWCGLTTSTRAPEERQWTCDGDPNGGGARRRGASRSRLHHTPSASETRIVCPAESRAHGSAPSVVDAPPGGEQRRPSDAPKEEARVDRHRGWASSGAGACRRRRPPERCQDADALGLDAAKLQAAERRRRDLAASLPRHPDHGRQAFGARLSATNARDNRRAVTRSRRQSTRRTRPCEGRRPHTWSLRARAAGDSRLGGGGWDGDGRSTAGY